MDGHWAYFKIVIAVNNVLLPPSQICLFLLHIPKCLHNKVDEAMLKQMFRLRIVGIYTIVDCEEEEKFTSRLHFHG